MTLWMIVLTYALNGVPMHRMLMDTAYDSRENCEEHIPSMLKELRREGASGYCVPMGLEK